MSRPTRRAVLTGASLSLIAGPAVVASAASMSSNPDAELLAACDEYHRLEDAYRLSAAGTDDDLMPPEGYSEAMAAVADIPAATLEGMRAKARAILHYQVGGSDYLSAIDMMRQSLLEDLAGGEVVPIVGASPDIAILTACERFHEAERRRRAADDVGGVTDERGAELDDAVDEAFDTVSSLKPVTEAGRRARAGVAAVAMVLAVKTFKSETWVDQADAHEWLAIDSLCDIAGISV